MEGQMVGGTDDIFTTEQEMKFANAKIFEKLFSNFNLIFFPHGYEQ